ncbi:MAG: NUDIX domain-containing protein [Gammaproteobacteria bacterium]|nr:MAG: NUDIX domain-containing protein [Gammaproteobacteria bacterium]
MTNELASRELLDVVDADDRVTGVKTRGEIHAQGLMHRAVHILVFNSGGELFIQKRSMSKDNNPGLWDSSAAGHVDSGEDYGDCAIRELGEELGIRVAAPLEQLFRLAACRITDMEHCVVYRYVSDGPFELEVAEIDEGAWISASEMDRRVSGDDPTMTRVLQLIWNKFRQDF